MSFPSHPAQPYPGQAYPPGQPGQPYPPGQPGQPYPPGQPGSPDEPYPPGQPGSPGQPYPSGQPGSPGQPYPPQPYTAYPPGTPQHSPGLPQPQIQSSVGQPPQVYAQPGQPQHYPEKAINQQPQAIPAMQVGGNKNVRNIPYDPNGRDWSYGLFDCCGDCGTCFFAWCCPCMVYAQNKKRLDHLNNKGTPDPTRGGAGIDGDCFIHCCITSLCALGWVLQISSRASTRARYRIKGGGLGDCCTSCCCSPCDLTQVSREIELEEKSFTHV